MGFGAGADGALDSNFPASICRRSTPPDLFYLVQGGISKNVTFSAIRQALAAFNNVTYLVPLGGSSDDAPQIRAAITSNSHVVMVGTFNLCSLQTSSYPATGGIGVHVLSQSNFTLDLSGAVITMCNAVVTGVTASAYFQFDQDTNYIVLGGNFIGNQTGKTGGDTVAIQSFNDVGFRYQSQVFTGDWQSNLGAPYDGDYDVNGVFDGAQMPNVTFCFDFGFIQNVTFSNFFATGEWAGGIGQDCLDVIYDVPLVGNNHTAYTINDSTNVSVYGGHASNFAEGWYVSSGTYYNFSNNFWFSNPGTASLAGYGGAILYFASGSSSSVGHPPGQINSTGEHYTNNGNATAGGEGIIISSGAITNSDVITGIHVNASFEGNIPTGIEATSSSHLADISVVAHCSGSAQTTCVGGNVSAIVTPTCSVAETSPISLVTATPKTICSITLTPGQWNISAFYGALSGTGATLSAFSAGISPTTNTLPGAFGPGYIVATPNLSGAATATYTGSVSVNIGATETLFLVEQATFSGGTGSGYGSLVATRD